MTRAYLGLQIIEHGSDLLLLFVDLFVWIERWWDVLRIFRFVILPADLVLTRAPFFWMSPTKVTSDLLFHFHSLINGTNIRRSRSNKVKKHGSLYDRTACTVPSAVVVMSFASRMTGKLSVDCRGTANNSIDGPLLTKSSKLNLNKSKRLLLPKNDCR